VIHEPRHPKPKTLLPFLSLATAALVTTGIGLSFQPLLAAHLATSDRNKQQAKQKTLPASSYLS
jgi:sulfate transport system substrate-binding protein